ncbi:MAG: hypothetical protein KKD31_07505 [Bacteroidetes bacterium]|nr:hypothetical protein [Bacteroidota bacterium]
MNKKKIISGFIGLAILMTASRPLFAQQDQTIYLMRDIPQATYSNPSLIPECKFYIGFPALSSFYLGIGNDGFTTRDVLRYDNTDSLTVDMDNLSDILKKKNNFLLNIKEELISFGFKVKRNYINFSISENFVSRLTYPGDLFAIINEGNASARFFGNTAEFKGAGFNMTHYREFALGYSRALSDKLVVGARPKMLFGMMNIHTRRSDVSFFTANFAEYIETNSDVLVNTSIPMAASMNDTLDPPEVEFSEYITNMDNKGFAIDLGGSYKYNDKFIFSASLIDLGWIHWKTNPMNYVSEYENANFRFDGFEINRMFIANDSVDFEETLADLLDSIQETFNIIEKNEDYNSPLNTKLYLNAVYTVNEKGKAGALLGFDFYNRGLHPSLTLSYNHRFGNILSLTGSYSMKNRNYANIGFGAALNLGPLQLYFVTDNILSMLIYDKITDGGDFGVPIPRYTRYMNGHFGINFIFGYKKKDPNIPSL